MDGQKRIITALMKNVILVGFGLYVMVGFSSCLDELQPVVCTEEFRMITLEVTGDTLDSWATVDLELHDTLQITNGSIVGSYVVLSDAELPRVENQSRVFLFLGYTDDSLVIQEPFVIEGDACHISKRSGVSSVHL